MLRVTRLTDRSGRYYLADLGTDLSAALDGGPVGGGRWVGRGAAALGMDGVAGANGLGAVLSGCHPVTGRPLRRHNTDICGFDLTFAAPKSVSVLYGLGAVDLARTVVAAHSDAVVHALDYVSLHALAARRGSSDERYLVGTEGAIGASFTHGLSRALDPHLHTHVVVANLAHGADGRWTAIDSRGLWAHARAAGALYAAHLRHELGLALGLEWSPRRNGTYELSAVDPAVIGAFSGRHAEIRRRLADHVARTGSGSGRPSARRWRSGPSPRAEAVAWAATREAKPNAVTVTELRRLWAVRASDAGYEIAAATRRMTPGAGEVPRRSEPTVLDEHRFAASLVTTARETPTRRAAVAAWAGGVGRGVPVPVVERCVDRITNWGRAIGVAEEVRPMAEVVAAPHLLRALGPRPSSYEALGVWQQAATAVERYRSHWQLEDPRQTLGVDGSAPALNQMGACRLAEHLSVTRQIEDSRRRLGRDLLRDPGVPELSLGRG